MEDAVVRKRVRDYNFVLANFPDGPVTIQGHWLTEDETHAAWPPLDKRVTPMAYDKWIQGGRREPEGHWRVFPVKIRYFNDIFSKVRLKLKQAEEVTDTDLNSDNDKNPTRNRKVTTHYGLNSSEDESEGLDAVSVKVPKAPSPQLTLGQFCKGQRMKEGLRSMSNERVKRNLVGENFGTSSHPHERLRSKSVNLRTDMQTNNGEDKLEREKGTSGKNNNSGTSKLDIGLFRGQTKLQTQGSLKDTGSPHSQTDTKTAKSQGATNASDSPSSLVGLTAKARGTPVATDSPQSKVDLQIAKAQGTPLGTNSPQSQGDLKAAKAQGTPVGTNSPQSQGDMKNAKAQAIALAAKMSDNEFKGYVILGFTELRSQMKELTSVVSKAKMHDRRQEAVPPSSSGNDTCSIDDDSTDPLSGLPAMDHETWNDFCEKLNRDKMFARQVVIKLKDCCAHTTAIDEYVRYALSLVMTNSLATEFNWGGRKKKQFSNQFFVKVLHFLLKKHTKFPRKEGDLKEIVSNWLRLAPQRSGGMKFRKYIPQLNSSKEARANGTTENDNETVNGDETPTKRTRRSPKKKTSPRKESSPKKDRKGAVTKSKLLTPNKVEELKKKLAKPKKTDASFSDIDNHFDSDHDQSFGLNNSGESEKALNPKKDRKGAVTKSGKEKRMKRMPHNSLDNYNNR
ncbi:uncharacterized protein LOC117650967 isoform X2 [Thrips palmi]|uniref:Uncharacterized protein LOC117650967 isoform X2 n=1 Tax=Thrips palmi TaxID=161013 RepID=A0A6P9A0T6_THRPL|nr:uncharacterized protein LOC117650967 isoform X2 [Thrips palmi]